MNHPARACIVIVLAAALIGCVAAAPGADLVKFTRNPGDVSACTPVGNISADAMHNLDAHIAQNLAVGLGGNIVFRTGAGGIAYHCANAAAPRQ